jgi:F-type H+-transporting ATPase subunit a
VISQALLAMVPSDVPFPPSLEEFFPGPIAGPNPWFTKFTLYTWVTVALLLIFFLVAYRKPKIVPTRGQWIAESVFGFTRNNIANEMIGHEGVRFAPYLTTLLSFILVMNLWAIIPGVQISPNSHYAFPVMLTIISYVLFNYVGIRRFGLRKYLKKSMIPPAPGFILPLLVPIETFSTFLVRPVTLSLRLFANMFAGHMILLVFSLGGFALLEASSVGVRPISVLSWLMAVLLTFLEALVIVLQSYVFVVLTSSYVSTAIAEDH